MQEINNIPYAGLCNRMRSIASAIKLGEDIGCSVIVHWNNTSDCRCNFSDLFKPINVPSAIVVDNNRLLYKIPSKYNFWIPRLLQYLKFSCIIYNFNKNTDGNLIPRLKGSRVLLVSCHSMYNHFYLNRIFVPQDSIMNQIDILTTNFSANTYGLHLRGTDHSISKNFSTIDKFERKIDALIQEDASVKFYLATDEELKKEYLINKYGNRILYKNSILKRNSPEGMKDALIDMFCLSKTKKIFGSKGSSYSEIAAEIGRIELEII